jgi:hypothetical protein
MGTYSTPIYIEVGGAKQVVSSGAELELSGELEVQSGGEVEVLSGGTLDVQGTHQVTAGALHSRPVVTLTENATLTAADSGKIIIAGAVDLVITLPATVAGVYFTFCQQAVSAGTGLSISPNAADNIAGGTDDKDYINTGATDVLGDCLTIVGNGTTGWVVVEKGGIWVHE